MLSVHFTRVDKRERVLASLDDNRRAVGIVNPMRDKSQGKLRGGEGETPVITACLECR